MAVGFLRRSISRGSINRRSQARALSTRVSESTLCPLGQSNKAIGHESPIGPCVATHRVDNYQACCVSENDLAPSQQRNGTTGKRKRISALAETKQQDTQPEQDHSQRWSARSNSWAECRDRNRPASSRRGDFSLEIPFYRTSAISVAGSNGRRNTCLKSIRRRLES